MKQLPLLILFISCFLWGRCVPSEQVHLQTNTPSYIPDSLITSQATVTALSFTKLPKPTVSLTTTFTSQSINTTSTPTPEATVTLINPIDVPTRQATVSPDAWKKLPVLPALNQRIVAIINDGLAKGNNPNVFSKIGDCESRTTWFLGDFDLGPKFYTLGPYESQLSPVVNFYQGSFNRLSLAAKPGYTSASVLAPIWADQQLCQKNESPLACEYRLNKPIMAFIMLGTNDAYNPKTFDGHMSAIIEFSLSQGVLPVLGTKADNVEGNEAINQKIALLAYQYDIPLWNYWRAVQNLPNHGLEIDGIHLTFGPARFDDLKNFQKAWPIRNLNALQILKTIMHVTSPTNK